MKEKHGITVVYKKNGNLRLKENGSFLETKLDVERESPLCEVKIERSCLYTNKASDHIKSTLSFWSQVLAYHNKIPFIQLFSYKTPLFSNHFFSLLGMKCKHLNMLESDFALFLQKNNVIHELFFELEEYQKNEDRTFGFQLNERQTLSVTWQETPISFELFVCNSNHVFSEGIWIREKEGERPIQCFVNGRDLFGYILGEVRKKEKKYALAHALHPPTTFFSPLFSFLPESSKRQIHADLLTRHDWQVIEKESASKQIQFLFKDIQGTSSITPFWFLDRFYLFHRFKEAEGSQLYSFEKERTEDFLLLCKELLTNNMCTLVDISFKVWESKWTPSTQIEL